MSDRLILLVEDDADTRAMMATALELDGFRVITAANGVEGISVACAEHPSAIVLDLMMPVMTGEQFRQAQMGLEALRAIPVVVVSARYDAPRIADRIGASGFLAKPVDMDALTERLRQFTS